MKAGSTENVICGDLHKDHPMCFLTSSPPCASKTFLSHQTDTKQGFCKWKRGSAPFFLVPFLSEYGKWHLQSSSAACPAPARGWDGPGPAPTPAKVFAVGIGMEQAPCSPGRVWISCLGCFPCCVLCFPGDGLRRVEKSRGQGLSALKWLRMLCEHTCSE